MRKRTLGVAMMALGGMLPGCTVGPDYVEPRLELPSAYAEAQSAAAPAAQVDPAGWWHVYKDAELERLIAIALAESPDVKTAAARITQARAQERVARAAYFPSVDATGGVSYERFSKNAGLSSLASLLGGGGGTGGSTSGGGNSGGIAPPGEDITVYSAGFDASWELDLFRRTRRSVESAGARTQAAIWNARDTQLSLIAEIVDNYLQLRTLQGREAIARDEIDRQSRRLTIMRNTAQSGLVPQGDYVRQRTGLAQAEAALGPIVADGKAQIHGLAILLGRPPESLIPELAVARPQLPPPPAVPPGLPSDLLRRRPDVRAAERNLAAATAEIGVAVADLYPRFSLTGVAQFISTALRNLFTGDSLQLSGQANAMFPVLDFGRRSGQVAVRRAQADEAYYAYQRTVLGALRDVENALVRISTESERNAALGRGVADALRAAQAVEARYQSGLVDFGAVLDARQAVLSDRDQLAQSDGALRRNLLALYKALGGGWENAPAH